MSNGPWIQKLLLGSLSATLHNKNKLFCAQYESGLTRPASLRPPPTAEGFG